MIVLAMGIIPKVLSKPGILVEVRKDKKPRKLVSLGSVLVMVAREGYFPLEWGRGARFLPLERDMEIQNLSFFSSHNYGLQIVP